MSQREILFKAKRADNGNWIQGNLIVNETTGQHMIMHVWPEHPDLYDFRTVIPETVCQYTGLTDKSGNKIFEGDIVKDRNGEDSVVIYGSFNCGCCYDVFGYTLDGNFDEFDKGIADECKCGIEVIGNIYDN